MANAIGRDGSGGDARVEEGRDDSTLAAYCTGRGIPQDEQRTHGGWREPGAVTCYTDCPVWRADRERSQALAELQADGVARRAAMPDRDAERIMAGVGA